MPSPRNFGALVAFALAFATVSAVSAPRITEFVAINAGSLVDGDGNTPDWIEIHNPDPAELDLSGYHLTDDVEIPSRYTFPAGTTITGGGYLVVFASGRPEADYIDAGGNLHTNFSLSGDGEYLALTAPDNTVIQEFLPPYPAQFEDVSFGVGTDASQTTLVAEGDTASWFIPSTDIGSSWQTPAFDDSAWNAAQTGIGYGYDPPLVGTGGDSRSQMWFVNASIYIRVPFEIADPSDVSALNLDMRFEDGFVAYLNGTRVAAANAPAAASLTHTSTATAEHPDEQVTVAETFPVSPAQLIAGTNILAIHGLNLTSSGANSSDFLALPELKATSSDATGDYGYFVAPTPGDTNGPTPLLGFVADTKFSHDRGYHSAAFDLAITSATPAATIIYTTDGTPPSVDNGTTYTTPIPISTTATIRAFALKDGFQPTNIDTQTYLFVDDIIRQTRPANYPPTWAGSPADYDMDADIVDDADYADKFDEAFAALPTLSLVFDPDALFDSSTGIYQNPSREGITWERPLSAEFIVPDGSEPGFQINAGIRVQGGSSRNPDTPKHSLSLRFRSEYGAGKLRYPLFENTPVGNTSIEEFDLLQLRPEYNFGWMHRHYYQAENALYGRDQWASDLFNSMGQPGSHGRWAHLFFNGIYWGLYDIHERPDSDFMANYFGGSDDDYDTVNSSVATAGDLVAFNEMMDLAYGSIQTTATYNAIKEYLDIDAFIDYMILNAYVGNRDWDGHNWRAARRREPGAGYIFFPWDTETAASHVGGGVFNPPPEFFGTALNTNSATKNGNRRPTGLQTRLQLNAEYRLRYADRVRAHFFNGGPMTPAHASELWTTRSAPMKLAIVAESARWGDFRRDVLSGRWSPAQFDLYTPNDHYLPLHDWLVGTYIPQRSDIVLGQLRALNLYPATDAPDFSQHGGTVERGFTLQLSAPDTIHYTTDGSDPRLEGGNINPTATSATTLTLNESAQVRARAHTAGGDWSALTTAAFTVAATDLVISEIMYNPTPEPLAEFIEIHNTGAFEVSLTGLHFSRGLTFDFDQHSSISSLAPDARLLIVRDLAAFQAIHGNAQDALIAGTFQDLSALSNSGETLEISDPNGAIVFSVTYNDKGAWPREADGDGRSLVFTGGDPAATDSWRASAAQGGNPGSTDTTSYTGGSLLAYALTAPIDISPTETGANLSFHLNLTADDAKIIVQQSPDLSAWETLDSPILTQTLNAEGTARTITVQLPEGTRGFARVVATLELQ